MILKKNTPYFCRPKVCGVPNVLGNDGLNRGAGDEAGLWKGYNKNINNNMYL